MKEITSENISQAIEYSRLLREKLLADTQRPGYHFVVPEDIAMPGDPNGAFYANGRYHLMYLYACRSDSFRWGHVSSTDLVHWRSHPDALIPDELDGGIFSGGAFVDDDGTAYMSYWGLPLPGSNGGIRIAKSAGPLYEVWEKYADYSLKATEGGLIQLQTPDGEDYIGCSDPSNIWKKDDKYYIQTGNLPILLKFRNTGLTPPANVKGDWVDLFESEDLYNWKYLHRFYERDASNADTAEDEDDMCPSFMPLPKSRDGGEESGKHFQLFISHNKGCQYYVGTYDKAADMFYRDVHGRMTWQDNHFFAPEALMDGQGRQIMWAWFLDHSDTDVTRGWSGVYSLPRTLWLNEDGGLGIAPVSELETLRYNARDYADTVLNSSSEPLDGLNPTSCEIVLTAQTSGADKAGIRILMPGNEAVYIYYDRTTGKLVLDTSACTAAGRPVKEEAPFLLKEGEELRLRIYIDKSVAEVFANDRQAIARRFHPAAQDKAVIELYSEGKVSFKGIKAWEIMPSNMY
ncbi:MAG: glycoside hydrolase family 32 protein [Eubacteriales bacterium]